MYIQFNPITGRYTGHVVHRNVRHFASASSRSALIDLLFKIKARHLHISYGL